MNRATAKDSHPVYVAWRLFWALSYKIDWVCFEIINEIINENIVYVNK